jgi:hypothetical protein
MTREFGPSAVAASIIVKADGIVASFARSVITGMMLLGRSTTPHRVFRDVDDSLAWALSLDSQSERIKTQAAQIREAVAELDL